MEDKFKTNGGINTGELNDDELAQVSGGQSKIWVKNQGPLSNLDIKTFTNDTLTRLGRVTTKPDSIVEDNS